VSNAKHACQESSRSDKRVIARVARDGEDIRISIIDNGVGIPPENLTRIFGFGFTTRKHGHGFGLHSGAISAKELDGSLIARSDGPGLGAEFILQLPVRPESQSAGGDPAKSVPQVPIRKDEADISAAA
jgi:C4-dicarboxylate-specific signal transduction histidine kinase